MSVEIPEALLERVPAEERNRHCICKRCVAAFHATPKTRSWKARSTHSDDFYFDHNNLMVFTANYLQRRGYCCGNSCRHCPYPKRP